MSRIVLPLKSGSLWAMAPKVEPVRHAKAVSRASIIVVKTRFIKLTSSNVYFRVQHGDVGWAGTQSNGIDIHRADSSIELHGQVGKLQQRIDERRDML